MLSQQDKDFIHYWETNRLRRKKTFIQFLIGIPIGLLFVIPIVINFSSGWDKRADMEANNANFSPAVLFVALLLILGFTAIFYQRHKWDRYEQHYRELLFRQRREEDGAKKSAENGGLAGSDRPAESYGPAESDGSAESQGEDAGNGPKME